MSAPVLPIVHIIDPAILQSSAFHNTSIRSEMLTEEYC